MDRRIPEKDIEPIFYERWSPRAFASKPVDKETILTVLEAARWAPSSMNEQPWYFLVGWQKDFDLFLSCLVKENQIWAKNAACLILVLYKKNFSNTGKENPTAAFDAGLAVMSLILQAHKLGLATHPMAGFQKEKTIELLKVPKDYEPICFIALGYLGDKSLLNESLQAREFPKGRKPLEKIYQFGPF